MSKKTTSTYVIRNDMSPKNMGETTLDESQRYESKM